MFIESELICEYYTCDDPKDLTTNIRIENAKEMCLKMVLMGNLDSNKSELLLGDEAELVQLETLKKQLFMKTKKGMYY